MRGAEEEALRLAEEERQAARMAMQEHQSAVRALMERVVQSLEQAVAHPGASNPTAQDDLAALTAVVQQSQIVEQAVMATTGDTAVLEELVARAEQHSRAVRLTPAPEPDNTQAPERSSRMARLRRGRTEGEGSTLERLRRLRRRRDGQPTASEPTPTPDVTPPKDAADATSEESLAARPGRVRRADSAEDEAPSPTRRRRRRGGSEAQPNAPTSQEEAVAPRIEPPQRLDATEDATQMMDRQALKAALRSSGSAADFRAQRVKLLREAGEADSPRARRRRRRGTASNDDDATTLFDPRAMKESFHLFEEDEEEPSDADRTVLFQRPTTKDPEDG